MIEYSFVLNALSDFMVSSFVLVEKCVYGCIFDFQIGVFLGNLLPHEASIWEKFIHALCVISLLFPFDERSRCTQLHVVNVYSNYQILKENLTCVLHKFCIF